MTLHIYDWNGRRWFGMMVALNLLTAHMLGLGVWHTGLDLGGWEYHYSYELATPRGLATRQQDAGRRDGVGVPVERGSSADSRAQLHVAARKQIRQHGGGISVYATRDRERRLPHRHRTAVKLGSVRMSELQVS